GGQPRRASTVAEPCRGVRSDDRKVPEPQRLSAHREVPERTRSGMMSIQMNRSNGSTRKPTTFGLHVFLACPITQLLDPDRHELPSDYEQFIRTLHQFLRLRADGVFLALEREGWGKAVMPAEVCTPLDFAEMQRCSVLVAYPGRSMGVGVEL